MFEGGERSFVVIDVGCKREIEPEVIRKSRSPEVVCRRRRVGVGSREVAWKCVRLTREVGMDNVLVHAGGHGGPGHRSDGDLHGACGELEGGTMRPG